MFHILKQIQPPISSLLLAGGIVISLGFSSVLSPVSAQIINAKPAFSAQKEDAPEPPTLEKLQTLQKEIETLDEKILPFDLRKDAITEAAISYGARGGLAARTYEIQLELDTRDRYLDKVFNFRELLIPAPSGLLIEPPILTESLNAMLIEGDGQTAAVSDKIYNIVMNAKIVSAPRNWRTYLAREWDLVVPPPDVLLPNTPEERELWIKKVVEGWDLGFEQANSIFQNQLNLMVADFNGMVRYRMLLAQGMISPPYALQVDRGITGDGDEMRIGDRAVQITGVPELMTGFDEWKPANR